MYPVSSRPPEASWLFRDGEAPILSKRFAHVDFSVVETVCRMQELRPIAIFSLSLFRKRLKSTWLVWGSFGLRRRRLWILEWRLQYHFVEMFNHNYSSQPNSTGCVKFASTSLYSWERQILRPSICWRIKLKTIAVSGFLPRPCSDSYHPVKR